MSVERKPPFVGWFVIEVDVEENRENPVYASITGPFASKEKAEHEADEQRAAWQRALDEWDGENPYDHKRWMVSEQHITDHQLDKLERMDEDRHRVMMDAVNAAGASLVADEMGMDFEELIDP